MTPAFWVTPRLKAAWIIGASGLAALVTIITVVQFGTRSASPAPKLIAATGGASDLDRSTAPTVSTDVTPPTMTTAVLGLGFARCPGNGTEDSRLLIAANPDDASGVESAWVQLSGAVDSRVALTPVSDGWWYGYLALPSGAREGLSGVFGAEDAAGNVGYAYDYLELACTSVR
jgi:hypothetical protein